MCVGSDSGLWREEREREGESEREEEKLGRRKGGREAKRGNKIKDYKEKRRLTDDLCFNLLNVAINCDHKSLHDAVLTQINWSPWQQITNKNANIKC